MTCPNCKNYDSCDAPLCPRDEQSVLDGCWFPDEPICPLRRNVPDWVRMQRRLTSAAVETYFTVTMLRAVRYPSRVGAGADPDRVPKSAEKAWLLEHNRSALKGGRCGIKRRARGAGDGLVEAAPGGAAQESKEVA